MVFKVMFSCCGNQGSRVNEIMGSGIKISSVKEEILKK